MTNAVSIDQSKLNLGLVMGVAKLRTTVDFNNASFNVVFRTSQALALDASNTALLDSNNQPVPGVTVRVKIGDTMYTAGVTYAGLVALSQNPHVTSINGGVRIGPA